MQYTIKLMTSDLENGEFVAFRKQRNIHTLLTGEVDMAGEYVEYFAETRAALIEMYLTFFLCGDNESDAETIAQIAEVQ